MTGAGQQLSSVLHDARIILNQEIHRYRHMRLVLLSAACGPLATLLLQVTLLATLSVRGAAAMPAAALLANQLLQALPTHQGLLATVATALLVGNLMLPRDRHSGALEGTLCTPITTCGLWLGRTLAAWLPGLVMLVLSLLIGLLGFLMMPRGLIEAGPRVLSAFALRTLLLLPTSFLLIALVTMIQLGGGRWVGLIAMLTLTATAISLVPLMAKRMMTVGGCDATTVVSGELIALPLLSGALAFLGPRLLQRERILRGVF